MKKLLFCLAMLCGVAIICPSCNKEKEEVKPETEDGSMAMGDKTLKIVSSRAVNYVQQNAIVLAAEQMTDADNEGVAVIFEGDITPGHYALGDSKEVTPKVVGLKDFNMGELQFVIGADSLFFGDVYYWVSGELSITEENGVYTVILSQCVATNSTGTNLSLSVNFNGTLVPYVISTENKFVIDGVETPIGLAGLTSIGLTDTVGNYLGTRSIVFMSPNHKKAFIISYLNNASIDGEYQLGTLFTPYLPTLPCVHVATDFDLWTGTPQTGYVAESGTLKVHTDADGVRTVVIENAKLHNLEHPNSIFFPVIDASLYYQGLMFEVGM